MSLSGKEILEALQHRRSKVYWISRNSGTKEDPNWENPEIEEAQEGDIAWFSAKATGDDVIEAEKLLTKSNLHVYSKALTEKKDPIYTKTGAWSMLVLPNIPKES